MEDLSLLIKYIEVAEKSVEESFCLELLKTCFLDIKMELEIVSFVFGLALTTVLGDYGCPENVYHKAFGGKCYYFYTSSKLFTDAGGQCRKIGGLLAQPKTKAINDVLAATLRNNQKLNRRFWIGLSDKDKEDVWVWDDGTVLHYPNDFSNFGKGEGPRNVIVKSNLEDRVALDPSGTWHDYIGKLKVGFITIHKEEKPFICEVKVRTTTQTTKRSTTHSRTRPTTPTKAQTKMPTTTPTAAPATTPTSTQPTTQPTTTMTTQPTTQITTQPTAQITTQSTTPTTARITTQPRAPIATKATTPTCEPLSILCPDVDCGLNGYLVDKTTGCYKCKCDG